MTANGADSTRRGSPGSIVLIVVGAITLLIALALGAGGGAVVWADQTQRDGDGYFTTHTHRFATSTYALTSDRVTIDGVRDVDLAKLGTVRVRATSTTPIFVGIARTKDVDRYLASVAHSKVTDFQSDPFDATYSDVAGSEKPVPPATARFWAASATGTGRVAATWKLHHGKWTAVVMNADGGRRVAADVQLGANVRHLGWVAGGLIAAAALLAALGIVLVTVGGRGAGGSRLPAPAPSPDAAGAVPAAARTYPVALEARLDEPLSRWLWLVKWFLAIPHLIVLAVLWVVFAVLTVVAFFAILFTERYPRGIFDFNVGVLRWSWRVGYYATSAFGTDRYPPFSLGEEPDYPARLDVAYPERLSRGLVLVKWWLLALPHYLIVALLAGDWAFGGWGWGDHAGGRWYGGGLVAILSVVAGIFLLLGRRYPRDLFALVVGMNRWVYRVAAYAALMTDEYPPFRLDQGGTEPTATPPAVPAAA